MRFTIFGAGGFIGGNLVAHLRRQGHDVLAVGRHDSPPLENLGHVIYAIGLTGDFRTRPFDTVDAHVCTLSRLLKSTDFESWLYLSSTRLYANLAPEEIAKEDSRVCVSPNSDSLYDISKLVGEALCLSHPQQKVRVVRLSNVYGHGQSRHTFLAAVLNELRMAKGVVIRESPESTKDYIALDDVLPLLEKIAQHGQRRIFNLASGIAISHFEIAQKLIQLTGLPVAFESNAVTRKFPKISISNLASEFAFEPRNLLEDMAALI